MNDQVRVAAAELVRFLSAHLPAISDGNRRIGHWAVAGKTPRTS